MRFLLLPRPNIIRILFVLFLVSSFSQYGWSQKLLSILPDGIFSPESEQVEDYNKGISIYDQYGIHNSVPKIRKESSGLPLDGKIEDYYSNGFLLHKGTYSKGVAKSYTNFYVNGSKERQYKGKKLGEGKLECFFLNGYYRGIYEYKDFNLVHREVYYENGVLEKQEEWNPETLTPTLIVSKNKGGSTTTTVELIDEDSLIYVKEVINSSGQKTEYGRMVLYPGTKDIINDGPYYTYSTTGIETSKVIYGNGNVEQIIEENRPEKKRKYFSYELPEEVVIADNSSPENTDDVKSTQLTSEVIPINLVRFDADADDFISNKELDRAVSEFFEDDSITLGQINGLVNFFFEQD